MKTFALSLFAIASLAAGSLSAETLPPGIHIGGEVKKPGYYPLTKLPTLKDLTQTFGGATEFGSIKRIVVVRFTLENSDPSRPQTQEMIPLEKLKREDGTYDLKDRDFIFVPMKLIIGR